MAHVKYFWDEIEDNAVREYDENNNTFVSYRTEPTLYGSVLSQDRSGEKSYFQFDGLGNTTELTDVSGSVTAMRRYSAFGETTQSFGISDVSLQYGGRWGYSSLPTLAQHSIRRRQYGISQARWFSRDTDAMTSLTPYEFCKSRPLNVYDPSGEVDFDEEVGSYLTWYRKESITGLTPTLEDKKFGYLGTAHSKIMRRPLMSVLKPVPGTQLWQTNDATDLVLLVLQPNGDCRLESGAGHQILDVVNLQPGTPFQFKAIPDKLGLAAAVDGGTICAGVERVKKRFGLIPWHLGADFGTVVLDADPFFAGTHIDPPKENWERASGMVKPLRSVTTTYVYYDADCVSSCNNPCTNAVLMEWMVMGILKTLPKPPFRFIEYYDYPGIATIQKYS